VNLKGKSKPTPETNSAEPVKLPVTHVAVIMDGNRRWANKHHLPGVVGHKEGVKSLKRLVKHVGALKLQYLTVYAFSSENWQRSEEEVGYLMQLFTDVLADEFQELAENKVRLRFIGHRDTMPDKLRERMEESVKETENNTGLNLQVAINYGSRQEITDAARALAIQVRDGKIKPEEIDEALLTKHLYTAEIPDPELLIRTGGEMRLSNYLLWQSAYTEFYVTPALWPEFQPRHFDEAIREFTRRERRWGGD
jgi:undecaprenyl diphosphate synthase